MSKRLFFKLLPAFVLLTFLAIVPIVIYGSKIISTWYYEKIQQELKNKALLLGNDFSQLFKNSENSEILNFFETVSKETNMRMSLILNSGKVIYDSNYQVDNMDNHANRNEVQRALNGNTSYEIRYSDTLRTDMLYYAQPFIENKKTIGVIRIAVPITDLENVLADFYWKLTLFGLFLALICSIIGTFIAKKFSAPMEKLYIGLKDYVAGDFSSKLKVESKDEIGEMALAMNEIGEKLQKSIGALAVSDRESKTILASMKEGVLAVDDKMRILKINVAAGEFLQIKSGDYHKVPFLDLVRNLTLENFINKVLVEQNFLEQDVTLFGEQNLQLNVKGTPLRDANGIAEGVVIVMNDVTQLRKLETMRKDFVANVSHELRTPISAIKGAIETLEMGAIEDINDAKMFLKILDKNSNRLSALIEDILQLSHLDSKQVKNEEKEDCNILEILEESIDACSLKVKNKEMKIICDCDKNLNWQIFPAFLQQAITNLIENGIKYSEKNKKIFISAKVLEIGKLKISVQDFGFGIAKEEQERIFERFYRVDKSHSNNIEGTGLGLAIVKHVVNAHNGKVELQSTLGEGTTFSIII